MVSVAEIEMGLIESRFFFNAPLRGKLMRWPGPESARALAPGPSGGDIGLRTLSLSVTCGLVMASWPSCLFFASLVGLFYFSNKYLFSAFLGGQKGSLGPVHGLAL